MCSSFVFAYPAQRLVACGSVPSFDNFDFAANFTDKTGKLFFATSLINSIIQEHEN